MLQKHGKLGKTSTGINKIMQPAIDLAENGFKIYPHLEKSIRYKSQKLREAKLLKNSDFAKIYLNQNMEPKKTGTLLVQKDLANTLRKIAKDGPQSFYQGSIAKAISQTSQKYSGALSLSDLKNYKSLWRQPIVGSYNNHKIYSMPIPSSGGIHLIQMLNICLLYTSPSPRDRG